MLEFYCEDGFLAPGLLSCLWDFLALMVTSVCTETFVFHKKIVWALLKGDPYYAAYSTAVLIGEVLAAAASMWFWSLEGECNTSAATLLQTLRSSYTSESCLACQPLTGCMCCLWLLRV